MLPSPTNIPIRPSVISIGFHDFSERGSTGASLFSLFSFRPGTRSKDDFQRDASPWSPVWHFSPVRCANISVASLEPSKFSASYISPQWAFTAFLTRNPGPTITMPRYPKCYRTWRLPIPNNPSTNTTRYTEKKATKQPKLRALDTKLLFLANPSPLEADMTADRTIWQIANTKEAQLWSSWIT